MMDKTHVWGVVGGGRAKETKKYREKSKHKETTLRPRLRVVSSTYECRRRYFVIPVERLLYYMYGGSARAARTEATTGTLLYCAADCYHCYSVTKILLITIIHNKQ
jgi:hypothetical protein